MRQRTLTRPPIVEALIDIAFDSSADEGAGSPGDSQWEVVFESLAAQLRGPEKVEAINHSFTMGVGAHTSSTTTVPAGARFRSHDGAQVVFVRRDGFTFSQVEGYATWGELVNQAQTFWRLLADNFPAASVSRVSTRFINVIQPPGVGVMGLLERMTLKPAAPDGFAMRPLQYVYQADFRAAEAVSVRLVQGLNPVAEQGAQLVLDISIVDDDVSLPASEFDAVWKRVNALREHKNSIFFSCFAESASEWFE